MRRSRIHIALNAWRSWPPVPEVGPNTLGLDDDIEPVEVLDSIERAFGIKITEAEAERCHTVADVYNLLVGRFATVDASADRCVTSMAFHRIRAALGDPEAGPRTSLASLSGLPPKRLFLRLRQATGLVTPAPALASTGLAGAWSVVAGLLMILPSIMLAPRVGWLVPVGLIAAGIALIRLDPGRLSPNHSTLGGMARSVAALNFGKLVEQGGISGPQTLWSALVEVLAQHSTLPKTQITPRTVLLASQLREAA